VIDARYWKSEDLAFIMAVTFSHAHMFRCMTVAEKYMASGSLTPRFSYALMNWCLYTHTQIRVYLYMFIYFLWHCSPARAMAFSSTRFRDHTNDAPQSVGLIWTSDQLVAETST
jgi:hypothetical protein